MGTRDARGPVPGPDDDRGAAVGAVAVGGGRAPAGAGAGGATVRHDVPGQRRGPQAAPDAPRRRLQGWLLEGLKDDAAHHQGPHGKVREGSERRSWWRVMCLTGVDYFSTLGYQPAIAFLAAGLLSPLATLVLVLLTLFGALPVYRRVARESPHGEGSIAMLEKVLPWWGGKVFVLVLLGFAATDFLITMTLSAADATKHLVENPYVPASWSAHPVLITLLLLTALGVVFLRGFREAIGVAVVLVVAFLGLNAVVVAVSLERVVTEPRVVGDWWTALTAAHANPLAALAVALLVFPKLALGLSGFETGVAVMPQVRGDAGDTEAVPTGRIRGTQRLLTTAAVTMSVFLLSSSVVTTLLIPAAEFEAGGSANGRALAYLAHEQLGAGFGTAYDVATIAILWFAGASAMAGLLNLVPRYLPRYGMAPAWAKAVRPLVLVLIAIAFLVTWIFEADVDAQAGAYATGVLVLITSASVAVTLSARRRGQRGAAVGFGAVAVVFLYTTAANVVERPDGVKIAACFIAAILLVSFASRVHRAFELRADTTTLDETAQRYVDEAAATGAIHVIAHEPGRGTSREYRTKLRDERRDSHIPTRGAVLFLEVTVTDPSDFATDLVVTGHEKAGHRVLGVESAAIPNTVAAVLLAVRDRTGVMPDVYFEWTEGDPVRNLLKFLVVGAGEVAPVTREVLRRAERDPSRRPRVHVG